MQKTQKEAGEQKRSWNSSGESRCTAKFSELKEVKGEEEEEERQVQRRKRERVGGWQARSYSRSSSSSRDPSHYRAAASAGERCRPNDLRLPRSRAKGAKAFALAAFFVVLFFSVGPFRDEGYTPASSYFTRGKADDGRACVRECEEETKALGCFSTRRAASRAKPDA
jgi:hypothetical protein